MLNIIIRTGDAAVGDMLRGRRGPENFAGPPYTWLGRSGGSLRNIGTGIRSSAGTSSASLNLPTANYTQSNTHCDRI